MNSKKGHRVITKWFQPYMILESAKKYFDVSDYTFTGHNKFEMMEKFINDINLSKCITAGLYMKNVNKFYVMKLKEEFNQNNDIEALENLLFKNRFESQENLESDDWVEIVNTSDEALKMIDLGKAEAAFILKQD